jgi:hypothetical protein
MNPKRLDEEFEYLLKKHGPAIVVTLMGPINHTAISKLEGLRNDIAEFQDVFLFIFNFKGVPRVSLDAFGEIVKVQMAIREREGAKLLIAEINQEVKTKLLKEGIIRTHELTDDLKVALTQISLGEKK